MSNTSGELTPEIEEAMSLVDLRTPTLVDATGRFIDKIQSSIEYWKRQEEESKKVRQGLECVLGRVKEKVLSLVDEPLEGERVKISKQLSPGRLEIDESKLHPQFMLEVRTLVPDKERIKNLLKEGALIEGANLVKEYSLRIRKISIRD